MAAARDATLAAARLAAADPAGLGGIWLRCPYGPRVDAILAALSARLPAGGRMRKLPLSVDGERLSGGLDLAATLAAGRPVRRGGLIAEAAGGLLVIPSAERLSESLAGRIAQALDRSGDFGLVLLDEGVGDEMAPAALAERVAFHIGPEAHEANRVKRGEPVAEERAVAALAATAAALGIGSSRAPLFALKAARASARLARRKLREGDLALATGLV
ncbi:MAG: magnesium chelatase, partial [Sphingomonadaceae bacterium]